MLPIPPSVEARSVWARPTFASTEVEVHGSVAPARAVRSSRGTSREKTLRQLGQIYLDMGEVGLAWQHVPSHLEKARMELRHKGPSRLSPERLSAIPSAWNVWKGWLSLNSPGADSFRPEPILPGLFLGI